MAANATAQHPQTPSLATSRTPGHAFVRSNHDYASARRLRAQGLSYVEIADETGIPSGTIRSRAAVEKWDINIERESIRGQADAESAKTVAKAWWWDKVCDLLIVSRRMQRMKIPGTWKELKVYLEAVDRHLDQGFKLFGLGEHAGHTLSAGRPVLDIDTRPVVDQFSRQDPSGETQATGEHELPVQLLPAPCGAPSLTNTPIETGLVGTGAEVRPIALTPTDPSAPA